MEQQTNISNEQESNNDWWNEWEKRNRRGKIAGGIILITAGIALLLRRMGVEGMPNWLFTWPMIPIAIGVIVAIKNNFRGFGWMVPILIGLAFLLLPAVSIHKIFWPGLLILIGLAFVFKPKNNHARFRRKMMWHKRHHRHHMHYSYQQPAEAAQPVSNEDFINVNSIMGGVEKQVVTKSFAGGEISSIMAGVEINLLQADFEGQVRLDVNAVLGGVKLIIPSHWQIKSELDVVMGGVEDKRAIVKDYTGTPKVLILDGSCILGGIEIIGY